MTQALTTPLHRTLRWLSLIFAVAMLGLLAAAAWPLLRVSGDPTSGFLERKGQLLEVEEIASRRLDDALLRELRLRSSSGLAVDVALRIPDRPLPGQPVMLLLGGQETGRAAAEIIPDTYGVTVAALSYPFGKISYRRLGALAAQFTRVQQGILDTPPATLLLFDYLRSQPDIAPGRIEIAGVSFGAFLAAIPAAMEPGFARLWLIHGSADPEQVIEQGLRKRVPFTPLRRALASYLAGAAAAGQLDPQYWVGRISPRPVVVISAREDSALPPDAVAQLHRALGQPSEVLWTEGDHVHPKRPASIEAITATMFGRIARTAESAVRPGA